jgi:tRNA-specific 2-thiouridylase
VKKRVVVGLSGGVDSSVAAYLLLQQGYEVIGIFMRNWHDESVTINNECPWIDDSNDAMLVAETLGIPFQVMDLSEDYRKRIVDYMFLEYERGRTPNPDVLCNREIKFDLFLKAALQLKADYVATGHYCRKSTTADNQGNTVYQLLRGKDDNKDQSYFLCQLSQEQLQYALFPIGELEKSKVREIAREAGLATAEKRDSQGLCFIGKVKLPVFLQQQLEAKVGKVILIEPEQINAFSPDLNTDFHTQLSGLCAPIVLSPDMGKVIGEHQGAHFYTIGQRKGLNIGGFSDPLFILGTDTQTNTVYCGMGEDHPGLYRRGLFIEQSQVHWIREDLKLQPGESSQYSVRIRYRQPLQEARLFQFEEGCYVLFNEAQKSIAAGQFAAWYSGDELIGSGEIFK